GLCRHRRAGAPPAGEEGIRPGSPRLSQGGGADGLAPRPRLRQNLFRLCNENTVMAAPPPSLPPPSLQPTSPASSSAGGTALEAQQALALWHRVLVEGLNRSLPDLTTRQFALFLEVYLAPPP